jgi:hypothetical protein
MDEKILAISCLCADCLQALGHEERPQQRMSDAAVVTTALVAMLFFRGNFEAARAPLRSIDAIDGFPVAACDHDRMPRVK